MSRSTVYVSGCAWPLGFTQIAVIETMGQCDPEFCVAPVGVFGDGGRYEGIAVGQIKDLVKGRTRSTFLDCLDTLAKRGIVAPVRDARSTFRLTNEGRRVFRLLRARNAALGGAPQAPPLPPPSAEEPIHA